MTLVDFSHDYYTILLKQPVPACRSGKFVHVINVDTKEDFFIIAPIDLSPYHATIVERFCDKNHIKGRYVSAKRDDFKILDPDWQVQGGGFWEINGGEQSIRLYGFSQAYGGCDLEDLRAKIQDEPDCFSRHQIFENLPRPF